MPPFVIECYPYVIVCIFPDVFLHVQTINKSVVLRMDESTARHGTLSMSSSDEGLYLEGSSPLRPRPSSALDGLPEQLPARAPGWERIAGLFKVAPEILIPARNLTVAMAHVAEWRALSGSMF